MCSNFICSLILLPSFLHQIFFQKLMEHYSIRKLLIDITFLDPFSFFFCFKDKDLHGIDDDTMEEPSSMTSANAIAIAHSLVETCLSPICRNLHR